MPAQFILKRLERCERGGALVEFALLAPLMIGMLLSVLQVGIGMQAYNAVRNVTADVAREAVVEYQTANKITATQIEQAASSTAIASPYLLDSDNLTVTVTQPTTQRVTGATEFQITVDYQVPLILPYFSFSAPTLTHTRPIFVIDE